MSIFLESPWPVVAMGSLMVLMLTAGLLKTGRGWLIFAILAVTALTLGMIGIERWVVTTREQVINTLDEIAGELQCGDTADVLRHVAVDADELRREAERLLPRITFHEVRVKRNLKISFTEADHLTASFNAVIVLSEKFGVDDKHHVPLFFTVEFVREGDAWKVTSYERSDPREGL